MDSILFSACYAFPPNSHGYCGSSSFAKTLKYCLAGKKKSSVLETELKKFKVQYAYLSLIARENNLSPFDPKVVHAFWIGNSLLDNVSHNSLKLFIEKDLFPKNSSRAKLLAKNLPKGMVPHHSFNSLYVNFVTDQVERSIENLDSCCITAGKITAINRGTATVDRFSINRADRFFIKNQTYQVDIVRNNIKLFNPKVDDRVAVHWGMAVAKLSLNDEKLLLKYTKKNLLALNKMFKK